MSASLFIDTNIFIYHLDSTDKQKSAIAESLIRSALIDGEAIISFQVVQECLNTILRKAEIPLDLVSARRYLRTVLMPLFRVPATIFLYERALEIQERYQFSFYDSLIVAAALEGGCQYLITEDLQHGQKVEQLTIRNPFL